MAHRCGNKLENVHLNEPTICYLHETTYGPILLSWHFKFTSIFKSMKTNKVILVFILVLSNLLSFSQLKVLSTGKVVVRVGTDNNIASLNIGDTDVNSIYSKMSYTAGWGIAIKSEVNRTDAIAFCAQYNDTQNFRVFGNGDIWGATSISFSDLNLKSNIKAIEGSLGNLKKLNGFTYNLKSDESEIKKTHTGLLAQDLEKIFPDMVYTDDKGVKGIAYLEIIPVLIEAIKEQDAKIEALTAQINECCKNNSNLKSASALTGTSTDLANNKASLDQNIPNPFSRETQIGCFIPDGTTTSMLYIYNMNGTQLQQYNISGKGKQAVTIYGSSFEPGMYLYALVIDGREVDTKRMILTK